ncbi:DNA repair protein RecO [Patescibacteria group bacterium]|nr:DNA repair protein RecO [Patescibacteria group bacterium]
MRSYKTEGIVIKRRNFGEADRILTIFSKRSGKIQVKAPGVRRITSKRSSHVELLNYCVFGLYEGKKLPVLIEAQSMDNFQNIKGDLNKIGLAFHFCELIDGLCAENQENIVAFSLFRSTLNNLSLKDADPEKLRENFETKLLNILGFLKLDMDQKPFNRTAFIEQILERKLKSRQVTLS